MVGLLIADVATSLQQTTSFEGSELDTNLKSSKGKRPKKTECSTNNVEFIYCCALQSAMVKYKDDGVLSN